MCEKMKKVHLYGYRNRANGPVATIQGGVGWKPMHCSPRLLSLNLRTCLLAQQRKRADLQTPATERHISRYMLLPSIAARSATSQVAAGDEQGKNVKKRGGGKSQPRPPSAKASEQRVNGLPPSLRRESSLDESAVSGESTADEAREDSSLTPASAGTARVRALMADLGAINQRIELSTCTPETTHGLDNVHLRYAGGYGTLMEGAPFPPGFGFYVVSEEAYSAAREPELCKMYTYILSLDGAEVQGQLLSFLDDCRQQRIIRQALNEERGASLQAVSEWMAKANGYLDSDMADVISLTESALRAEDEMGRMCLQSMQSVNTLFGFTTVMKIMQTMEPPPLDLSSNLNICASPLTKDIANVLDLYRSKFSMAGGIQKLDKFESLLTKMSVDVSRREYIIEFLAKTIMNRQRQLQFVKDECKQIEESLVVRRQLLKRLEREAAQQEKAQEQTARILGIVKKRKVSCLLRKDALAQTDNTPTSQAQSAPLMNLKSNACTNRSRNASSSRRWDADLNQNMRTPSKTAQSAPDKKDEKDLNVVKVQTPSVGGGTEEETEQDPETLLLMVNQFVALLRSRGRTLTEILTVAHGMAEQEAALLNEQRDKISSPRSQCQSLMALLQKQSKMISIIKSQSTVSLIHNFSSPSHTCLFCSCHMLGNPTELAADDSVRSSYSRLLIDIKSQYTEAQELLSHCDSLIASSSDMVFFENTLVGLQFPWEESTSSPADHEDLDSKAENVEMALGVAKGLVSTMGLMSKHLLEVIGQVRERLAALQEQNDSLVGLQEDVDRMESALGSTAWAVARLRAGSDYLSSSRTLKSLRCPYCRCYNAASWDPSWMAGGELGREALLLVLSAVRQGSRSVLSRAELKEVEQPSLVSGVEPEVLSLLEETSSSVLQLLQQVVDPSVSARPSQTRSDSSLGNK